MVLWIDGWRCPYCKTEYKEYSDATRCADECRDCDEPEAISMMICEMCGEDYLYEADAFSCEETHRLNDDTHYQKYLHKKNFAELKKAANVPGQQRLNEGL